MKIISCNIARRADCWEHLLSLDADVALLQEATEPPSEIAKRIHAGREEENAMGNESTDSSAGRHDPMGSKRDATICHRSRG